jgi:hypothetical protein
MDNKNELYDALYALCLMWDQYCSDEWGHRCMSAGENTEIILDRYGLLIHKDRYEAEVDWNMLETLKDKI